MKSPRGFDEAYVGLFTTAQRVGGRILGDPLAAESVAVETLSRALARWRRAQRRPEPWVVRTATNVALHQLTRRAPLPAPPGLRSPDGTALTRAEVLDGLRSLKRRQRQVIALRYLVELSEEEIAEVLAVGIEVVRARLQRGLVALRKRLGPPRLVAEDLMPAPPLAQDDAMAPDHAMAKDDAMGQDDSRPEDPRQWDTRQLSAHQDAQP